MEWKNEARIKKNTKHYTNRHEAVRALLGGIGTGNISIDTSGRLCDFEIFGHADKHLKLPYTFFSMWSKVEGEESDARILEAAPQGISNHAIGTPSLQLGGLPRFDSSTFACRYPFVEVELKRENSPFKVVAEAFTPFIPLDMEKSGIPGFKIVYKVTNLSDKPAQVSICGTLPNIGGMFKYNGFDSFENEGTHSNKTIRENGLTGIEFNVSDLPEEHLTRGGFAIATTAKNVTVKPCWQFGGWWDGAEEFWQDFSEDGELCADVHSDAIGSKLDPTEGDQYIGSLAAKQEIMPGETKEYVFYLTWHFPNRYGWWPDGHHEFEDKPVNVRVVQNYYSTLWDNAWAVCDSLHSNIEMLTDKSRKFADALYSSTLDSDVIESFVSAITVLRSPTCFRTADGKFYGWEGCFDHAGSCPGNCTHVWNYAQALAYLFPKMEQDMRRTELLIETSETGEMAFRAKTILNGERWNMLPATDGQLGSILRVYREWKISGDREFLTDLWDKVKLAIEFSLKTWDSDGDFVLDSQQHNTYDIEFYGINSLTNSILYATLLACAEMAEFLGETQQAKEWRNAVKSGAKKMDSMLWNGEYYKQGINEKDLNKYRYQYGNGCLADQLLGQQWAHLYGLGYILPKEHVRSAVKSIYHNNFKPSLENHHSVQRGYAYQDEGGLLLCSWPYGGRPKAPFVYSDEVWTGIEYQVAVNLVYEGLIHEAMDIVHAIRNRYNGFRRSPYNEVECGHHYARSMASWGLLIALSGYDCDQPNNKIQFSPRVNEDNFSCFYSSGKSWGVYEQKKQADGTVTCKIKPLYGDLDGMEINDGNCEVV